MRKTLALLMALTLMLSFCLSSRAESMLGEAMGDFTVETATGETFTLSEVLKDRDMVLINFWATWCGYCELEFPYLQQAYERYSDRVAVLALSVEPGDTAALMTRFAADLGLTFDFASDSATQLANRFAVWSVPTSLVVDRFGNVAFVAAGAERTSARFEALFDFFTDEGYTQTVALSDFPAPKPNVEQADAEALARAANAEGSDIPFANPEDGMVWPMLPTVDGERAALRATNGGIKDSDCAVYAHVTAADGDALAFTVRTDTPTHQDALLVLVDGEIVKRFSGRYDWTDWAIPLGEGAHEIGFLYACKSENGSLDPMGLSGVRLASGDEAAALLAALPVYPVSEAFGVAPDGGSRVVFDDAQGVIASSFDADEAWIVGDRVAVRFALTADMDPDLAFVELSNGASASMASLLDADGAGYSLDLSLDQGVLALYAYPDTDAATRGLLLFKAEEDVDAFVQYVNGYGFEVGWRYE